MGKTITIRCKNTGRSHKIPIGFTLEEVYEMLEIKMPFEPTSAKVNNKVEGLHFMFFNDKDVEFLDVTSPSGLRTYTRSLFSCSTKPCATSILERVCASTPPFPTAISANSKRRAA